MKILIAVLELSQNNSLMADMIKTAQFEILKTINNSLGIYSVVNGATTMYNMYAKSCWYYETIATRPHFEDKWESVPVSFPCKINCSNSEDSKKLSNVLQDANINSYLLGYLEPCTTTICCKYTYGTIWTKNEDGTGTLSQIEYKSEGPNETVECTNHCFGICDKVKLDDYVGKISGSSNGSSIVPNPNSGTMTLKINSEETGEMIIKVSDVNGYILYKKLFIKTTEDYSIEFTIPEISNGNYYYTITQDNKELQQGGFTVQK